jgi:rhamnogalacturonyl hydrolase YesR
MPRCPVKQVVKKSLKDFFTGTQQQQQQQHMWYCVLYRGFKKSVILYGGIRTP